MSLEYLSLKRRPLFSMFVALSLAVLTACGGGGGGGGGGGSVGGTPVPPPSGGGGGGGSGGGTGGTPSPIFDLAGGAAKGIILGGYVSVEDAAIPGVEIGEGTTSTTDGSYSLSVLDDSGFDGQFIRVIVTGGTGAMMICDAASGCGGNVVFGEAYPINESVRLEAIIPAPVGNDPVDVFVSPLTDLSANLADNMGLSASNLAKANSQVANLFGLQNPELTRIPTFDITAPSGTPTRDQLRLASISAGILEAAIESGETLDGFLESLAQSFIANGGQLVSNEADDDPTVTSLEDILNGAIAAIELSGSDLDESQDLLAALLGELTALQSELPNDLSTAVPSPNSGSTNLEKGMAFIDDLRLVNTAIMLQEQQDGSLANFADDVEASIGLLEADGEDLFADLFKVIEDILEGGEAYDKDQTITSFTGTNGTQIGISTLNGLVTIRIADQVVSGTRIDLVATIDPPLILGSSSQDSSASTTSFTERLLFNGGLELEGRSSNSALELDIERAIFEAVDFDGGETSSTAFTNSSPTSFTTINSDRSLERLVLNIKGRLSEIETSELLSLEGVFEIEINSLFSSLNSGTLPFSFFLAPDPTAAYLFEGVAEFETGTFGTGPSEVGFSGALAKGESLIELSFFVGVPEYWAFESETQPVPFFNYAVDNDKFTITSVLDNFDSTGEYSLVTSAEIQTELASFGVQRPTTAFFNLILPDPSVPGGNRYILFVGPSPDDVYVRIDSRFLGIPFLSYYPTNVLGVRPSQQYIYAPGDTIVDVLNRRDPVFQSAVVCYANVDLVAYLEPLVSIDPLGGVRNGIVLSENYPCSSIMSSTTEFFNVPFSAVPTPGGDLNGIFALSVSQNVAGIDLNDPGVTLSASGPVSFSQNQAEGKLSLALSFAGRRYETDGISFDLLDDDFAGPISITNQDGIVLTAGLDENGDLEGTLMLEDELLGTISVANGVPIITYEDANSTTESLL